MGIARQDERSVSVEVERVRRCQGQHDLVVVSEAARRLQNRLRFLRSVAI